MASSTGAKATFLIPSALGVVLFMIPVKVGSKWTIGIKILSDAIGGLLGSFLPTLCGLILTVSALGALWGLSKPKALTTNEVLRDAFVVGPVWVVLRLLGCLFCWLCLLGGAAGAESGDLVAVITHKDTGMMALELIVGLAVTFLAASFLLPLLLDFGLLEFVGALLTRVMRPLFKVPGRAAVDCTTSWIGDGTLGVMLTCNQYEEGYYNAKEASIIATTFSAVSITFSLVVLTEVGLTHMFGAFYLLVCLVGVVCAIICPRLPPLRGKPETYLVKGRAMPDALPEGYASAFQYGLHLAARRAAGFRGLGAYLAAGCRNCAGMWFGVLPTVMAVGVIALVTATRTPLLDWLGLPFRPLLELLRVPDAAAAASTMVVGFADMFTPAIIIAGNPNDITRFIVAVVSITQVLFLDEVGGVILASKLPINLPELFVIFLERTLISLLIVCPLAHLLF